MSSAQQSARNSPIQSSAFESFWASHFVASCDLYVCALGSTCHLKTFGLVREACSVEERKTEGWSDVGEGLGGVARAVWVVPGCQGPG